MSDIAKMSEEFVNFTNDSEKKLFDLKRDWIDQLPLPVSLEQKDTVKAALGASVARIESIFIPNEMPDEDIQREIADATRSWVCSRAMANQSVAFFIVGTPTGIEMYLADDDAKKEIIESAFPGVSFGNRSNPCQNMDKFQSKALITGLPTSIHNDTVLAYSCDKLLRGMRGKSFMLALVAKPVPKKNIQALLQKTRNEISANHDKIKSQITEGLGKNTANTIGASVGFSAGMFAAIISTLSISNNINLGMTFAAKPLGVGVDTTIGTNHSITSTIGSTIGGFISGNVNGSISRARNTSKSSNEERLNQFAQAYESKLSEQEERLKIALSEGLWQTATYICAENKDELETCTSIYQSVLTSRFDPQEVFRALPISSARQTTLGIPLFTGQSGERKNAYSLLTTSELSSMIVFPTEDHPGIIVKKTPKFSLNQINSNKSDNIVLGKFCDRNVPIVNNVAFPKDDLTGHMLVAGITGSGKSTTIRTVLSQVNVPFLVFEPAKSEYRQLKINDKNIRVLTAGDELAAPLRINPFEIAEGDSLHSNIDALSATINAAFPMEGPMAALVEQGLLRAYKDAGWDTSTGAPPQDFRVPTMNEFYSALEKTIDAQKYEGEYGSNIKSALLTRINSLRIGPRGRLFNSETPFDIEDLLSAPTVIEMRKIGSDETKSFLTGILLYRVYRYFENLNNQGKNNSSLKAILVIEEAHRLFRKTAEQASGITGNNTRHHSVEMFENIMAEIRAYGLGLIIAEQLPLRLSDGAVKNTNIKIIHKLAAREDAIEMGGGMGLDEKKSAFVNILPRGEALVITPNLLESAHVKIIPQELKTVSQVQITDKKIRESWSKNFGMIRPPHFETVIEKISEKMPSFLPDTGNDMFLNMMLCSIKHINEVWETKAWTVFNNISQQRYGIQYKNEDLRLLSTHILHFAVAETIRGRKYLSVNEKQQLRLIWDKCLELNDKSQNYSINIEKIVDLKQKLRSFVCQKNNTLPNWVANILAPTKLTPVFAEALLFADEICSSNKDISTTIKRDIDVTCSIVGRNIKKLSDRKILGDDYCNFGFCVMLHIINKFRIKDYEKQSLQGKIYYNMKKYFGGKN